MRVGILALAAFAPFDRSVITPLFGDQTTSFVLNREALEVVLSSIQILHTITMATPLPLSLLFNKEGM